MSGESRELSSLCVNTQACTYRSTYRFWPWWGNILLICFSLLALSRTHLTLVIIITNDSALFFASADGCSIGSNGLFSSLHQREWSITSLFKSFRHESPASGGFSIYMYICRSSGSMWDGPAAPLSVLWSSALKNMRLMRTNITITIELKWVIKNNTINPSWFIEYWFSFSRTSKLCPGSHFRSPRRGLFKVRHRQNWPSCICWLGN